MKTKNLYLALTRPSQKFGVSHEWFILITTATMLFFIGSGNPLFIFLLVPLFYLARWINKSDPHLLTVLFKKLQLTPLVKNNRYWGGCNSYDPLAKDNV